MPPTPINCKIYQNGYYTRLMPIGKDRKTKYVYGGINRLYKAVKKTIAIGANKIQRII